MIPDGVAIDIPENEQCLYSFANSWSRQDLEKRDKRSFCNLVVADEFTFSNGEVFAQITLENPNLDLLAEFSNPGVHKSKCGVFLYAP